MTAVDLGPEITLAIWLTILLAILCALVWFGWH